MRELRPYQLEAVAAIRADWAAGVTRTAIVMATGLGKTDVIAKIATDAAREGKRVLIIAHRGELLDQITERCQMHDPSIPVGRVQASRNQTRRPITVAMAPTLASEKRRAQLLPPDLLIVDEAHHAASPSQMSILTAYGAFDGTPTLGVTATMTRGDRRGLGDVWQNVCYERSIQWAISEGWLTPLIGRAVVVDHMDLSRAKVSRGDFQDGALGEMVAQDVDQIVKAWQEHAAGRITVAFTPNVASAQALADEFTLAGVHVGTVFGSTPPDERRLTYKALAAGEIRVLCSVMVTTEGWDLPEVACILQCRPTKLPGLLTQMVGRGARTHPSKRDCLILDVVGATRTVGLASVIDLHPTMEYDTSALPACEDCGLRPCACVKPERDPDGGRIKLQGPARYADLDLFSKSVCTWLFTTKGIRFLPVGKQIVVLWPDSNDPADDETTYSVGHMELRGNAVGQELDAGTPHTLDEARLIGEAWALAQDASLASRGASWRRGGPSPAQLDYAVKLRIPDPELMNKARLSDEISIVLASRRLHR